METRMLYVHALSPIHVGIGQGTGVIDLPVIRETVTGWPYLPGSSVKGVLREASTDALSAAGHDDDTVKQMIAVTFGPETDKASDHAGGVIVADLRLLFFPVRAMRGGFAWVTSPLALDRWARDADRDGLPAGSTAREVADGGIVLPGDAAQNALASGGDVRLEDLKLDITVPGDTALARIVGDIAGACFAENTWRQFFASHAGVVSDTTFSFLTRTATEVTARNRIDPTRKIVAEGALWLEEAIPAEAILAGPLVATDQGIARYRAKIDENAGDDAHAREIAAGIETPVQIGGNASVGRGIAQARMAPGVEAAATAGTGGAR
jgi:CRISPR-associated protein Cmr4